MNMYLQLFLSFAKIGVMTFGGGPAMLPMLEKELVENKKWVSEEEILDFYAIGQCTPGIIAVNVATFVGHKHKGVLGGIVATFGMIFPCLVIIDIIAAFLENFMGIDAVQYAFAGIRVCVCALILNALISFVKKSCVDIPTAVICFVVAVGTIFLKVSPVIFVVFAGIAGVVIKNLEVKKK